MEEECGEADDDLHEAGHEGVGDVVPKLIVELQPNLSSHSHTKETEQ